MIITIKGADFSSANIGTLSTYIISKSIGSGAAFDIPNFVDKNSSVNWVITLDEGYTFGTYSVIMGGNAITPSVVDNVMTISIAEVTGNVRIVVATVNENTGEEDIPVVPPVTPDEPESQVYTLTSSDIEAGGWGLYDKMDNTKRLRTKHLYNVKGGTTINIALPSNLDVCVTVLKPDGSTTDIKDAIVRDLWTTQTSISVPEDGQLHLVWKNKADTNISTSEWGGTYSFTTIGAV
jgi:hypothetical protein